MMKFVILGKKCVHCGKRIGWFDRNVVVNQIDRFLTVYHEKCYLKSQIEQLEKCVDELNKKLCKPFRIDTDMISQECGNTKEIVLSPEVYQELYKDYLFKNCVTRDKNSMYILNIIIKIDPNIKGWYLIKKR